MLLIVLELSWFIMYFLAVLCFTQSVQPVLCKQILKYNRTEQEQLLSTYTNVFQYLSHPSLGWLYVFRSLLPLRAWPPRVPQWLLLLSSKLFELNLRYLGQKNISLGKCTDDLCVTLTQGHGCGIDKQKFACLQDKVRTTQPITTKLGSYILLVMLITW